MIIVRVEKSDEDVQDFVEDTILKSDHISLAVPTSNDKIV